MSTESSSRSDWQNWGPWCAVWLWGCVAYHNSFAGLYVYDDFRALLQNPRVQTGPSLQDWLRPVNRPLTEATFALNYALNGFERWGWHLGNLLIHLVTASLWLWLVREALQRHRWQEQTGWLPAWTAALCAGLWVAHPITTEAVTYLVQRSEALAACGMLATLVCWNRSVLRENYRSLWLAAALVCAFCAAASKPTAVVLPILVWLYDWDLRGRQVWSFRWTLALLWLPTLWILSDAYLAGLLSSPETLDGATPTQTATAGVGAAGLTTADYLSGQAGVVCYYLGLILSGTSQSLDYGWLVPERARAIWGPAAGVTTLLVLSALLWRRNPGLGSLALGYFVLLLPTSSVIPLRDLAVEHRVYLPSVCVVTLVVVGCILGIRSRHAVSMPGWVTTGLLFYGVFLTTRTIQRNADYHDDVRLWTRAVAVSPRHPRNYGMLGVAWQARGELQQAQTAFETSVDLYRTEQGKPVAAPLEIANAYSQLATVSLDRGEPQRAQELLEAAVEIAPQVATFRANLGGVYDRQQQLERAAECYRQALELDPKLIIARVNLARLLLRQNTASEALAVLEPIQDTTPTVEVWHLLADVYGRLERYDEAHATYQQLSDRKLATSETWQVRGKLYRTQRNYAAALNCFETAAREAPQDPWPLALQAEMLARLGDFDAADQLAASLLQQLPADSVVAGQLRALRASLRP